MELVVKKHTKCCKSQYINADQFIRDLEKINAGIVKNNHASISTRNLWMKRVTLTIGAAFNTTRL